MYMYMYGRSETWPLAWYLPIVKVCLGNFFSSLGIKKKTTFTTTFTIYYKNMLEKKDFFHDYCRSNISFFFLTNAMKKVRFKQKVDKRVS